MNNPAESALEDTVAPELDKRDLINDYEDEEVYVAVWPLLHVELTAFKELNSVDRVAAITKGQDRSGKDAPLELAALYGLEDVEEIFPLRASNYEIAEKYPDTFNVEYGHGTASAIFDYVENPEDMSQQIEWINNWLDSSRTMLREEGVSIHLLRGLIESAYNPNLDYGEGNEELQQRYGELIVEEAEDYFEDVSLERNFADIYYDSDHFVILQNPK